MSKTEDNKSRIAGLIPGAGPQNPLAVAFSRSSDLAAEWSELPFRVFIASNQVALDMMTRQMVTEWIEKDKRTHSVPDGTSAAGRHYVSMKDTYGSPDGVVMKWMSMLPNWPRQMMFKSKAFQNIMRSDLMVRQFRLIDSIIREHYPDDHGTLFNPEYNHQFLTENSNNEIVAVDENAIIALFQKPHAESSSGTPYPRLLITSSHAQGESLKDVTAITHGLEALARDSHGGKALNHGYIDKGVQPGQTLTLYACDVEEGPWLNGAALLARINELKEIARTGKPDRFEQISPGAKRIAKLMLKCMVEQPERIDTKDPRHINDIIADGEPPLRLREDAIDIANHFQLIGYSKGGNVVSDAMRYLVSEISAKDKEGHSLFQPHPSSPSYDENGQLRTHNIYDIVRGISVMALAAIEVGMDRHYKECGVRRVAFNNKHDLISEHKNYQSAVFDERYLIEGTSNHLGHHPSDMMGTRGSDMEEAIVGYAHEDEKVTRRLMEFFAPNYGDAAIGHVYFDKDAAKKGEFLIEAASGTTDGELTQHLDKIKAALVSHHLFGVTIARDLDKTGIYKVVCAPKDVTVDFTKDHAALKNLRAAFHDLRMDRENPVVTMRIENEIAAFASRHGMKGFDTAVNEKAANAKNSGRTRGGAEKPSGSKWGMNRKDAPDGSALNDLTR